MNARVRIERVGEVAVIVIDNPPVNAGSAEVRRGLLDAVDAFALDDALRAAVLIGAGNTFVAGLDLKEFDGPLVEPQLPAVIAAIEACTKPFVAALQGAALGGGFELALGCDERVASPGTLLGLPEVTLGMIPGAGGTQRLPRLVGIATAIDLISAGRRVEAPRALALGMIDAIADGDLREFAVARALRARKRRVIELPLPVEKSGAARQAECEALRAGAGRPSVAMAIAAIKSAADTPPSEALAAERADFQRLRVGGDAFALRHLLFAERDAARPVDLQGAAALRVVRLGIVGAGTLGCGIARAALAAGLAVTLCDDSAPTLARALRHLKDLQASPAGEAARLRSAGDDGVLADAQLVIVTTDLGLSELTAKVDRIEHHLVPGAMLLARVAGVELAMLADAAQHPQQLAGARFGHPARALGLVEIARSAYTAPELAATAFAFALARRLGWLPILCAGDFIGARVHSAGQRECAQLLSDGAMPAQVDAALAAFGFAPGLFTTSGRVRGTHGAGVDADAIVPRLLTAMASEAALLLAEGATTRVTDIDVAQVHGYGFPKWEGGPAFWACRSGRLGDARSGAPGADLSLLRRLMPQGRLPPAER